MFNVLLVLSPLLAAQIVIDAFAEQGFGGQPTGAAIAGTRAEIDAAFADLVAVSGDPDGYWAQMVDERLREGDLDGARGFLLGAPQMLSRDRSASVARAADEQESQNFDERLIAAAVIFLPPDVGARYERMTAPPVPRLIDNEIANTETGNTMQGQVLQAVEAVPLTDDAGTEPTVPAAVSDATTNPVTAPPVRQVFDLVGDAEDLTNRSARWLRGEPSDPLVLRLRGFAQVARDAVAREEGAPAPFTDSDLALGVSVLTAAQRAGRLHPDFVRHLRARIGTVLPEDALKMALQPALDDITTTVVRAARVRSVFVETTRPGPARRLALELELVARIAENTSPAAAMQLTRLVRSENDLRRLRLLTEAGGNRVTALGSVLGEDVLLLATSGGRWSTELSIRVMLLAAMGLVMFFAMLAALTASLQEKRGGPAVI